MTMRPQQTPQPRRTRSATKAVVFPSCTFVPFVVNILSSCTDCPNPKTSVSHFPLLAIYNRQFQCPVYEGALLLTDINFPTDPHTNLLMAVSLVALHRRRSDLGSGLLYFFNLGQRPVHERARSRHQGQNRTRPHVARAVVVSLGIGSHRHHRAGVLGPHRLHRRQKRATQRRRQLPAYRWPPSFASGPSPGPSCMRALPGKGVLDKGPVLAVIYTIIVLAASWLFLRLNDHGWGEQSPASHRHRRRHGFGS